MLIRLCGTRRPADTFALVAPTTSTPMFHHMLSDLRLALRRLLTTPAASLTVVAALSVGIGLCALMFSVIDGAILPALPFENGDRVVHVARADRSPISADTYLYWNERQRSFAGLGMAPGRAMNLEIDGRAPEPVLTAALTTSTFALLSVQPALGRPFLTADAAPGAPAVVLVSDRIWRTRLAGRSRCHPRARRACEQQAGGDCRRHARGLRLPVEPGFLDAASRRRQLRGIGPSSSGCCARASRLRQPPPNSTALDAQRPRLASELMPTAVRLSMFTDIFNPPGQARLIAGFHADRRASRAPGRLRERDQRPARACRGAGAREVAVRAALGASRARIATQFWIEVSVLALAGAAGGVLLQLIGIRLIRNALVAAEGLPFWWGLRMDLPVLAFISIAAALAAIAAGVGPALFAFRANSHALLKDSSRTSSSRRLCELPFSAAARRRGDGRLARAPRRRRPVHPERLQPSDLRIFVRARDRLTPLASRCRKGGMRARRPRERRSLNDSKGPLAAMPDASSAAIVTTLPGFTGPGEGDGRRRHAPSIGIRHGIRRRIRRGTSLADDALHCGDAGLLPDVPDTRPPRGGCSTRATARAACPSRS